MKGLEYLCTTNNVKYIQLAEYLGITKQNINAWIKGKRNIPPKYLPALAEYFKTTEIFLNKDVDVNGNEIISVFDGDKHDLIVNGKYEEMPDYMDYLFEEDETLERINKCIKNIEGKEVEPIPAKRKNRLQVYKWFIRVLEGTRVPPHHLINIFKAVMIVYGDEENKCPNEYVENLVRTISNNRELERERQRTRSNVNKSNDEHK